MARALIQLLGDVADATVLDNCGNMYRVPSLREPIALELLAHGVYESATQQVITTTLRTGDTFVDVGANIGALALTAARDVGHLGRVYAIEASARIYAYLVHNIALNKQASIIKPLNVAVINQDDVEVPFFDAASSSFGMGSLGSWPADGQLMSSVKGRSLDSLLGDWDTRTIRLLKVDVEGFEYRVFAGATKLLTADAPPRIVFEFVDWAESNAGFVPGDAQRLLQRMGYTLYRIDDWLRKGRALERTITSGSEMIVAEFAEGEQG